MKFKIVNIILFLMKKQFGLWLVILRQIVLSMNLMEIRLQL